MLNINFTPFPNLETERLVLRQLKPEDDNEIFSLRSDERVNKYILRTKAKSIEDAQEFIIKINKAISNNESIYWAIALENNSKLIGTIMYWNISKENLRAEIGYELHPDYQGKGLMQEAFSKVVEFGFDKIGLHSIEALVDPYNFASIKLLERNNFLKEAHFKENIFHDGKFLDTVIYSLINKAKEE